MTKTTYVMRDGQLVEKPKLPPEIEMLPADLVSLQELRGFYEFEAIMRRQIAKAFGG